MTYPTIFNNLPGTPSTNPASLFDSMFNIVGAMGNIPVTTTGTNALTWTPVTNFFLPAAYANFQMVTWTQPATSTGAVTAQLGGLGFKQVIMPSQIQAQAGDLVINQNYTAVFCSNLNASAGGWQVINTLAPVVVQPPKASFSNLTVGPNTNTTIPITADELVLETVAGNASVRLRNVNVTITTSSSGAGGVDTGTITTNRFYYLYVIFNPTTVTTNGLMSLQAALGSVILPAGYTFAALVGAIPTSPIATNLLGILQRGDMTEYLVGTASTALLPSMSSGVNGNPFTPTFQGVVVSPTTATSASNFVPVIAKAIRVLGLLGTNTSTMIVCPSTAYGGATTISNPPPMIIQGANTNGNPTAVVEFVVPGGFTQSIQWASNGANNAIFCQGWRNNL